MKMYRPYGGDIFEEGLTGVFLKQPAEIFLTDAKGRGCGIKREFPAEIFADPSHDLGNPLEIQIVGSVIRGNVPLCVFFVKAVQKFIQSGGEEELVSVAGVLEDIKHFKHGVENMVFL